MASDSNEPRAITWDDFGPWLSRLRRRRGLSQQRLAAQLGCDRITIWRYENGKRPSKLMLRDIERVAKLSVREARWLAGFIELRELHSGACALHGDDAW